MEMVELMEYADIGASSSLSKETALEIEWSDVSNIRKDMHQNFRE